MGLTVEIRKRMGDFSLRVSLENEVPVLGLLGASGCGKSMTLKCIAGIEKPDSGRIILDGEPLFDSEKGVNLPPQKRRVGYLFQNYALFPNMNVWQNIQCGLKWEKDKEKKKQAAREMIQLMRLEGLERHRPAQLSGGQAQRTALARILVNRPRLLLLDEPFSALDSHLRYSLQLEMIDLLKQFGVNAVLVTHDRDEAYHMCQRIGVMDQGRMVIIKETKELFAAPELERAAALTGCKNIVRARKAGEYLARIPDWSITLETGEPLRDDLWGVAVRAHYFNPRTRHNRIPVTYAYQIEEPFEWNIQFRTAGQKPGTPNLWWRVPKDRKPEPLPAELGIAPVNVLPLYPDPGREG